MSGDHNMNQLREGYRNYDSPVAMPGEFVNVDVPRGLTLEEYFACVSKLHDDTGKSVRDQQVAGTHYQKAIQPWDIISEWKLDFWEGNVVKYILRWKHKDGLQDLKKAKHYLEYLIERESNDKQETNN
jgi:hypothetical protein